MRVSFKYWDWPTFLLVLKLGCLIPLPTTHLLGSLGYSLAGAGPALLWIHLVLGILGFTVSGGGQWNSKTEEKGVANENRSYEESDSVGDFKCRGVDRSDSAG